MSINESTNIHGESPDERAYYTSRQFTLDLENAIKKGIISASKDIESSRMSMSESDRARLYRNRSLETIGIRSRKAKMNWTLRRIAKDMGWLVASIVAAVVFGAIPYLLLSAEEISIPSGYGIFITEVCSVVSLWALYQMVRAWGRATATWDLHMRYRDRQAVLEGEVRGKLYRPYTDQGGRQ